MAAAIRKNGRYLIGKRPVNGLLSGLWEFPAGPVSPGETHQKALVRTVREQLGMEVKVGGFLASVDHTYSHMSM